MQSLKSIIEGVIDAEARPFRMKVTKLTDNTPRAMPVHNQQRKQPRSKPEMKYLATPGGLMRCTLPEFDPSTYKGLKQNCGKPRKPEPVPITAEQFREAKRLLEAVSLKPDANGNFVFPPVKKD